MKGTLLIRPLNDVEDAQKVDKTNFESTECFLNNLALVYLLVFMLQDALPKKYRFLRIFAGVRFPNISNLQIASPRLLHK